MFDGVIENPIALVGLAAGLLIAALTCVSAWRKGSALGTQAPLADYVGLAILAATWVVMLPLNVVDKALPGGLVLVFGAEANDSGIVEGLTVAGWALSAVLCLRVAWGEVGGLRLIFLTGALVAVILLGEEISWGQWLLRWTSPDFFAAHNLQSETNAHNFLSPTFYDWLYRLVGLAMAALATAVRFRTPIIRLTLFDRLNGWINHTRWGLPLTLTAAALMQHAAFQELCEAVLAGAVIHALLSIRAVQPGRLQARIRWALGQA